MRKTQIGKLKPRFSFILNSHSDVRVSRCPMCEKLTHPRKFAFLVHVEEWGPMVQGKTAKFCSACELIVVHQDELEAELVHSFEKLDPELIGNPYLVLGTVETKTWKRGLKGDPGTLEEILQQTADFDRVLTLQVDPGGWRPAASTSSRPD